ncbi:MAG TPA: hypothetical protein VHD87_15345 [Acidimicrobiales bacterium]|nr:hypothetical protein [Acidimicrobiales bacterium]
MAPDTAPPCVVLDSMGFSTTIAEKLGLPVVNQPVPATSDLAPMVVVVEEPGDIPTLVDRRHDLKIGALIAFRLAEDDIINLYDVGPHVFIGVPDRGELLGVVESGVRYTDEERAQLKRRASRISHLEALLAKPTQRIDV